MIILLTYLISPYFHKKKHQIYFSKVYQVFLLFLNWVTSFIFLVNENKNWLKITNVYDYIYFDSLPI